MKKNSSHIRREELLELAARIQLEAQRNAIVMKMPDNLRSIFAGVLARAITTALEPTGYTNGDYIKAMATLALETTKRDNPKNISMVNAATQELDIDIT